jgi:hypothetical protein
MVSMASADLDAAVDEHLIGDEPAEGTAAEVRAVAQHHRQLLHHEPRSKYTKKDQVKPAWMVTDPYALIAGTPDLGKATDDLLTTDIPGKPGAKQWTYACVLIALAKLDEGYRTTKELTKTDPGRIEDAVQALHEYYVDNDVQYDDSATRFSIMKRWGYTPVWVGKCPWTSLPSQVALPAEQTYCISSTSRATRSW